MGRRRRSRRGRVRDGRTGGPARAGRWARGRRGQRRTKNLYLQFDLPWVPGASLLLGAHNVQLRDSPLGAFLDDDAWGIQLAWRQESVAVQLSNGEGRRERAGERGRQYLLCGPAVGGRDEGRDRDPGRADRSSTALLRLAELLFDPFADQRRLCSKARERRRRPGVPGAHPRSAERLQRGLVETPVPGTSSSSSSKSVRSWRCQNAARA